MSCKCICLVCKSSHGPKWIGCEECDKSICITCGKSTKQKKPKILLKFVEKKIHKK